MTDREFYELAAAMREAQRAFFAGDKSAATVGRAKSLERAFDRELAARTAPPPARTLFDPPPDAGDAA